MTDIIVPRFGDLIKMPAGGFDALPDADVPYYVQGSDGLYVRRKFLFGHGAARTQAPANWVKLGYSVGQFQFTANPIPAKLMSQIVHFFRRIYERQHTEAAVLLTMHEETGEWGVYIPTQLVSHGGVNYVFDPQTINGNRTIVGSIHSHCDFSPFHSGTDTGDAADFDGFHATVGFITKDEPGIVAMVSMNKQNMHYKPELFPKLFDYTELWQHEAPAWWDRYVEDTRSDSRKHPVGFSLYKKFEKTTVVKEEKRNVVPFKPSTTPSRWTPPLQHQNQQTKSAEEAAKVFMRGLGITPVSKDPWWLDKSPEWLDNNGFAWDNEKQTFLFDRSRLNRGPVEQPTPLRESQEFNARKAAERGVRWDDEGRLVRDYESDLMSTFFDVGWMDELTRATSEDFVDQLLMSSTSIINEDDDLYAYEHPEEAATVEFWQDLLVARIKQGAKLLEMTGLRVDISLVSREMTEEMKDQQWLLPEDTKPQETHHGVH